MEPLQCLCDVPQCLMFLTMLYSRSHADRWTSAHSVDVSTFYEAFLRMCAAYIKDNRCGFLGGCKSPSGRVKNDSIGTQGHQGFYSLIPDLPIGLCNLEELASTPLLPYLLSKCPNVQAVHCTLLLYPHIPLLLTKHTCSLFSARLLSVS